jgi:hypothetical protein
VDVYAEFVRQSTAQTIAKQETRMGAPPTVRRTTGILRVLVGLLVLAAIVTQISDQLVNDAFVPEEYFGYFTIQTSLMNIVALIAGGAFAMRNTRDAEPLASVRLCVVAYAAVTGGVYNVLLRGIPSDGFVGIQWPNEVMHVGVPVFLALDWLFAPGRSALPWNRIWLAVSYPLAWVGFTLVRGAVNGWYPYPFLEPGGAAGWGGVAVHVLGIALLIVGLAAAAIGTSRFTPGAVGTVRSP